MAPFVVCWLLFVALMSGADLAVAVRLPGVEGLFPTTPSQESQEPVRLPEPNDLEANWWRYFEGEPGALEAKIPPVLERLEQLEAELSPAVREAAEPLLSLIRANLQALPIARAQESPNPPAPRVFAEAYDLDELLAVYRQLEDVREQQAQERDDVTDIDQAIKAVQRSIDTTLAAYLLLPPSAVERLLQGLEIMAKRLELGVAEERLRTRRAALRADAVRVAQLVAELDAARERLAVSAADLTDRQGRLAAAQEALELARDRSIEEQAAALRAGADSPEERATARYRRQRVIRAAVAEAAARLDVARLVAEVELLRLLLERPVDTDVLRQRLAQGRDRLQGLAQTAAMWASDSERERGRTGEAVSTAVLEESDTPAFIKLINQDRFSLAQETLVAIQRLEETMGSTRLVFELVEAQLLAKEGRFRDWLARGQQILGELWQLAEEGATSSLFRLGETPVTALGLLRIVLIITLAWWVSYWLRRALQQLGERGDELNVSAYYTVGRLSHYVIIVVGFMVGLSSVGVDFTNFALVAGALAIGIGFGLQSVVNNFISGLILLFERTLKVGDFVELASGIEGEVREINVRSTVINTNDNVDIVVPNSELMNNKVINWTLIENYRRIHLPFKVAYGSDKELVRQAGLEAAEKVPHTLTGIPGKNPGVWLVGFGDSCLEFELVVWLTHRAVKRPGAVQAAYLWEIETALRKYGVKVPFPQRDLHLKSGFDLKALLDTVHSHPVELTEPPHAAGGRD